MKTLDISRKAKELFRKGQELEVCITAVETFGAFGVIIVDGIEYTALIHRSIIKDKEPYIEVARHFKIGDTVKGIVKNFDQKGNMSLSTTKYYNLLPDYFKEVEEIMEKQSDTSSKELVSETKKENTLKEEITEEQKLNTFYEELKPTLESVLQYISPEAEAKFKETIQEIGVVKFCLSLGKISPTFRVDPGLILAHSIEEDNRGCL